MLTKTDAISVVHNAIDDINDLRETPITKDEASILFGNNGQLDSLELVNLVVALEEQLADKGFDGISLVDEKAMSQHRSPFRTVDSLSDYICNLSQNTSQ